MSRVLAAVLLFCVLLPFFSWFPSHDLPAASVPPYQLLNETTALSPTELASLDVDDGAALMDLPHFRWLLGGKRLSSCDGLADGAPLVLVLVHTATDHAEHRALIRETWGAPREGLLVRFLVGLPEEDDAQRLLENEEETHGDLVQGSFVDGYRNITYKHAMGLRWFSTRCPNATYILKVDDDVIVNTPVLFDFLRRDLSPFGARRLVACSVETHAAVKRSFRSKWRVSYREFADSQYPPYCHGWAVLYSPDVALSLYLALQRQTYFWIDDVLITGMLVKRQGLKHASWSSEGEGVVLTREELPSLLRGERKPTFMLGLWYNLDLDMNTHRVLWTLIDNATVPRITR